MNKSDVCIYSYLFLLSVCSVIYAFYVVIGGGSYTPAVSVNVALPPTILTNTEDLLSQLQYIKNSTVVHGVAIDVWWGLVETIPQKYDWSAYSQLFALVNQTGLKVKAVFAFHASTKYNIPLPSWVLDVGANNSNIYYTDQHQFHNPEYLSSGVDHMPLFPPAGRSAVEMYSDFVQNFADAFGALYFDTLIYEVQIGLGPAGEFRYPAYPDGLWAFPGIGEFQCYDTYLSGEYSNSAYKNGQSSYAALPNNTVSYNSTPKASPFFSKGNDNYESGYGQFFLNWYSNRLIQHGKSIMSQATSILNVYSPNVTVSAKLGCVFWQYNDETHAAEITAGYLSYTSIAQMFKAFGIIMEFPCFDLKDKDQPDDSNSGPQALILEILQTAETVGISLEGQNSIADVNSYDQIEKTCKRNNIPLIGFDYHSLSDDLISGKNLTDFAKFVDTLSDPSTH